MKKLIKDIIIIICILPLLLLESVNSSKQNLRVERNSNDDCSSCSEDNFNTDPRCYDTYTRNCCRVCEKGQYRSGDCYLDTDYYDEWTFTCSKCGKGTHQPGYNVRSECLDCPDVPCPPNEEYIGDCDKYSGDYPCGDVTTESNTSVIATDVTTESNTSVIATESNTGMIVGIVIGVIVLLLIIIIGGVGISWYRRQDVTQNNGYRRQDVTHNNGGQTQNPHIRQHSNSENGGSPMAPVENDDSNSYVLNDGVSYVDFQYYVAEKLTVDNSQLHRFYDRLGLDDHDCRNVEADKITQGVVETRNEVLRMWVRKIGKSDEIRVQLLLSALWKLELRECRRDIIDSKCKKVPPSTEV